VSSDGGQRRAGSRKRILVAAANRRALGLAAGLIALLVPAVVLAATGLPVADPTAPADRDVEPVILTGQSFPAWSVPSNQTAKAPGTDRTGNPLTGERSCISEGDSSCPHNHYVKPEADTADTGQQPSGTPVGRLLGYRYDPDSGQFVQIPFQVDEMFTRYLSNNASGFSFYSGDDQHTTYAFDREGFRFTASDPNNPCHAVPAIDPSSDNPQPGGPPTTPDPIRGLDDNDEMAFMASDAGAQAPPTATLPKGINGVREVTITDPLTGKASYAYVMRAATGGPQPAYNADNGYVRYMRDPGADTFVHSQSSYGGYGNAPHGPYCDQNGNVIGTGQRRPGDQATISTDRYRFRYDGRWLMTGLQISPNNSGLSSDNYGPDLVDRWKARAFQQDPESDTPCCGYEEEDTNWGGSSQLLGERVGPVRAIRATWGADSGTNVIRMETFYRDEVRQKSWLRVHVIPPLDGIYAQWDFNAGIVNRYYNPNTQNPATGQDGVAVDGKNDEVFGNLDDPCNSKYDAANDPNNTSSLDQQYRSTYKQAGLCPLPGGYHQSIDVADPSMSKLNASLDWNEITGPHGTIVDRTQIDKVTDLTPGGAAQSLAAVPYYRDDSCFDDGTGTDPGLEIHPRGDEPKTYNGVPRKCWDSNTDAAVPGGDPHYFQGDIGTHGLHLLFQVDSDNARQTVPLDEIVSESRLVMLPGERDAAAGEQYGRNFEKPLVATVAPASLQNSAPDAQFSYDPATPTSGDPVNFDARDSSDSDAVSVGENDVSTGQITDYKWDFDGDGQFETDSGSSPQATHGFARPGTHQVELQVTDIRGATDTTSHDVSVANRPPTAAIDSSPASPKSGDEVTFDGSRSADPDGTIADYQWDLDGDGSFETDTQGTPTASRHYGKGSHEIHLRVTDDSGATADATTTIQVGNRSPHSAISSSPGSPSTGDAVTFDGSGSSDEDGSIQDYKWDLDGDGSYETDTGNSAQASRSYARPGTYTVGLRVTDEDGASDDSTAQVQVANRSPRAVIALSPASPTTFEPVSFEAAGSGDPDGTVERYQWDLDGNGNFETDTGGADHVTRAYSQAGTLPVAVRVTDDSGAAEQASLNLTVLDRAFGFRLDATRSGQATLAYTARRPVHGLLELQLVGVGKRAERTLARQSLTSDQAGDVSLGWRFARIARRCRRFSSCRLVAHGNASVDGATLYDETKRQKLG
jgi:PKD repeat protein